MRAVLQSSRALAAVSVELQQKSSQSTSTFLIASLSVSSSRKRPRIRIADPFISPMPLLSPRLGMKLALTDVDEESLQQTVEEVSPIVGASNILATLIDVGNLDEVVKFKEKVFEAWDEV